MELITQKDLISLGTFLILLGKVLTPTLTKAVVLAFEMSVTLAAMELFEPMVIRIIFGTFLHKSCMSEGKGQSSWFVCLNKICSRAKTGLMLKIDGTTLKKVRAMLTKGSVLIPVRIVLRVRVQRWHIYGYCLTFVKFVSTGKKQGKKIQKIYKKLQIVVNAPALPIRLKMLKKVKVLGLQGCVNQQRMEEF